MEDVNWFGILRKWWEILITTIALEPKIEHKKILDLNSQQIVFSFMSMKQKGLNLAWTYEYTQYSATFKHRKHRSTNIKTQTKAKKQEINKQKHFPTHWTF
jgi:hypothetical protein